MTTSNGNLRTVRRGGKWWIVSDDPSFVECGAYDTRREADDDRRGLERTARYGHQRRFWTTEQSHGRTKAG